MKINDNILRDLWDSRSCFADQPEVTEEYKATLKQMAICQEKIGKIIAPKDKKLLLELSDANSNLEAIAEYQAFEYGFRLAVKLLAAVLKN